MVTLGVTWGVSGCSVSVELPMVMGRLPFIHTRIIYSEMQQCQMPAMRGLVLTSVHHHVVPPQLDDSK